MKLWWAQCPSKDMAVSLGLLLGTLVGIGIYELGVISHQNGVVDCSWFEDGDVKYHKEKSVETHVLAGKGECMGFCIKNSRELPC